MREITLEHFDLGISRKWFDDNTICLIRTKGDMSREAIDMWAGVVILTVQTWKKGVPLAMLHDLSHYSQGITPYSRKRTDDILQLMPKDVPVFSAIVLPPTLMAQIIRAFINTFLRSYQNHTLHVFGTQEEALEWLREKLKTVPSA